MKKTYNRPSIKTVVLQRPNLLSGSLKGDGINVTITNDNADFDAEGREFGFEDDE